MLLKIYRLLKGFFVVVVVVVVFSFFLFFFFKTVGLILKGGAVAVAGAFLFPLCYFIQLNLEYMTQNTKTHTNFAPSNALQELSSEFHIHIGYFNFTV